MAGTIVGFTVVVVVGKTDDKEGSVVVVVLPSVVVLPEGDVFEMLLSEEAEGNGK